MNFFIISIVGAWVCAQLIKVILQRDVRAFLDVGGMPSAHSALVGSLAAAVVMREGFSSTISVVAIVLALIVVHDAVKVRRHHNLNEAIVGLLLGAVIAIVMGIL